MQVLSNTCAYTHTDTHTHACIHTYMHIIESHPSPPLLPQTSHYITSLWKTSKRVRGIPSSKSLQGGRGAYYRRTRSSRVDCSPQYIHDRVLAITYESEADHQGDAVDDRR